MKIHTRPDSESLKVEYEYTQTYSFSILVLEQPLLLAMAESVRCTFY